MRIIAGTHSRMPILPPRDRTTRPITDRAKESLFNIIQWRIAGVQVADLFCGTGSMGLEALSRGAEGVVFVDQDRDALSRLDRNIAKCRFEDRSHVVQGDVFTLGIPRPPLWYLHGQDARENRGCGLVFVDPPYRLAEQAGPDSGLGRLLVMVSEQAAAEALVVVRHPLETRLAERYARLELSDRREYGGTMAITFMETIGG